ncbi:bifunctional adenosylcobinamide kinase/adenosylcobinamide-phosphate guanylyltransferase [Vibrio navarrensis]
MKALILGGARSGKSSYAEALVRNWCEQSAGTLHYLATAMPFDNEMSERIAHHKAQRGNGWQEHEAPLLLAEYLARFEAQDVVLIDCLTVWLNNWLFELAEQADNAQLEEKVAQLCQALIACPASVVMVSNEVGLGVVPMGKVSRLFVDNAGRMNQRLAQICQQVTLVAAGLPLDLKKAEWHV